MQPKTKLEKRVIELGGSLSSLSKAKIRWAKVNVIKDAIQRYKTIYCLECGHDWKVEYYFKDYPKDHVRCPACKKKLNVHQKLDYRNYFVGFLEVKEEFQVIRSFEVMKRLKPKSKPEYSFYEVEQKWITPKGKIICCGKKSTSGMFSYQVNFGWWSPMEIRKRTKTCGFHETDIYPKMELIPELKRNGFNGRFYRNNLAEFLQKLLTNPKVELLVKANQSGVLERLSEDQIEEWWPQLRLAIKHKYHITDFYLWRDYLESIKFFKKDLTSPRWIFPKDVKKSHDVWLSKRKKAELHTKYLEALKKDLEYRKRVEPFKDLIITDGEITIRPLLSIKDFYEEETRMHHCVFTNRYFEKTNMLLLTSSTADTILETIEFDLKNKYVVQSRGVCNKYTDFHERIISLVQENLIPKRKKKVK